MTCLRVFLATALLTAACSPVEQTFTDAAIDASATFDATPVDAAEGAVTITVVGDEGDIGKGVQYGVPVAGVDVYFINPDGNVQKVVSAADGKATATIVTGAAAVVARRPDARSLYATAFLDLAPGMAITAGARPDQPGTTIAGSVTFSMNAVSGASYYTLAASCLNGSTFATMPSISTTFAAGCPQLGSATVVMTAHGGGGDVLGYATRSGLNLPTVFGTTQALGAASATIPATVTYTNIPTGVGDINARIQYRQDGMVFAEGAAQSTVTSNSLVLTSPIVPIGANTIVRSTIRPDGELIEVSHRKRTMSRLSSSTLDVGAGIIPFSTYPSFDPVSRTGAWTLSGGGDRRADAVYVHGSWSLPDQSAFVQFTIIGAGHRTSMTLPPLPPELAAFVPVAGTSGSIYELYMVDVVGAEYPTVVEHMNAEARALYFDDTAFPAATEYWYIANLPL